jgi:hypothetical protein
MTWVIKSKVLQIKKNETESLINQMLKDETKKKINYTKKSKKNF